LASRSRSGSGTARRRTSARFLELADLRRARPGLRAGRARSPRRRQGPQSPPSTRSPAAGSRSSDAVRHKDRNVLEHLPEFDRLGVNGTSWPPGSSPTIRTPWRGALAGELAHSHPRAAASLAEGLAKTLTLQRLGVDEQLWRTLSSTTTIKSMIGTCCRTSKNVKHWAERRHVPALVRPPACSKPKPSSARSSATSTARHSPSPSRTTSPPHPPPSRSTTPDPAGRYARARSATAKLHGKRDNLGDSETLDAARVSKVGDTRLEPVTSTLSTGSALEGPFASSLQFKHISTSRCAARRRGT